MTSSGPQLSLVNELADALLRAPAADRARAATEVLARAGIRVGVVDGRLVLPSGLESELATALRNVFALGAETGTEVDATLGQFEEQLVQSGKMAAIGELARGVAHEINNPLFAILGLTEFLLRDAEAGTKAHTRLTLVHDTGLELKQIVRALLEFARESAEERRLVDLGETVGQTLELVRRTSSAKDVEIVERLPDVPAAAHGSPNQLKQILLNLLTNAAQALPGGGTVTVALARDERWATVTVTDTGPGIPEELRSRVFEPFFTTKGGTGLGLAVSRTIAEAHDGTLAVESPADGGAAFVLRLPLASEAA